MASFFQTNLVNVFPSAYRTANAGGRFTSETNITSAIRAVCELDSFVAGLENDILSVVIHGYYFEISMSAFTSGNLGKNL